MRSAYSYKLQIIVYFWVLICNSLKVYLDNANPSGRAVTGRSLAESAGSNPTVGIDVCLL
jgi:hypothetical protein